MKTEPVAVATAFAAIINAVVLIVLKKELSVEEQTAIVTAVTVMWGAFARSRVKPVA